VRVHWKKVVTYYIATLGVTHGLSFSYVALGGVWGTPGSYAVANALMLCPGAVALVLQRWVYHEPIRASLGLRFRPNRWFSVAWLLPPGLVLAALGLNLLLPGARYSPDLGGLPPAMASLRQQVRAVPAAPMATMLASGLMLGPTLNAIGGLGEELGWRGLLQKELGPLGFWRSSALIGLLWALWHVPTFLAGYGGPDQWLGLMAMVAEVLSLAPILSYLRVRSGSVVACAILHGTLGSSRLVMVGFVEDAGALAKFTLPLVEAALCLTLYAYLRSRKEVDRVLQGGQI
jgi:uncharacterized protein